MMLIFGLMLLLQTAAGLELNCSFGQSDPCYTALGDKLNLLMERDAREYELKIRKRIYNPQDDPVCRVKNGRIKECDLYNNRPEVNIINGIVIINRVIRADSGNYRLTLVHSDGTETFQGDLQVIVEVPNQVVLIVLGCFTVILIILVAISYYIYKKKNRLKTTANVENTSTDAQTNRNEKKEQELHYGEVTFSSSNVKQQPSKTQEECVYAQVQMN